ncbi:MAG: translation initiation factor IF-2 [Lachnospiraceae bacterium]
MPRHKVYELAKELCVSNKTILALLRLKGVDVKSHMSIVEPHQEETIRRMIAGGFDIKKDTEAEIQLQKETNQAENIEKKGQDRTTVRPKKKNLIRVDRPQNAKTQEGKKFHMSAKPAKPAEKPAKKETVAAKTKPQTAAPVKEETKAAVKPAETKPVETKTAEKKSPEVKPAETKAAPAKAEEAKTPAAKPAEKPAEKPTESRSQNAGRNNGERRPAGAQGQRRDGERRPAGGQGQRRDGDRRQGQGGQRPFNRNGEGFRGQKNGQDSERKSQGGFGQRRDGDRRQGQGGQRPFGKDGDNNSRRPSFGRNDNRKPVSEPDMGLAKKPSREGKKEKDKEREKASQRENKMTNDRKSGGNRPNQGMRQKSRLPKALQKPVHPQPKKEEPKEVITEIKIPEKLTIRELAEAMKKQPSELVKKLFMQGMMVTVNQEIDFEKASEIALEYEIIAEPEEKVDVIAELLKEDEEAEETMTSRPPVVCVMGHVDHGKTSLLDAIRNTRVTDREAGGITQAIGASVVEVDGRKITFLDTPGHEAFTAMRMRGASSTDIAVLVVAADDGVMPQTLEAISHAKAAGVELIVAINKIDKPGANPDHVKQELSEQGLIPEDWGGNTVCVPVSARTHEGIDELLEMILLTADVMELKANPDRRARGLVIEAKLDKGKGPVASILVQKGTLHVGDFIAAGACSGKVRAMTDDRGRRVKTAGPSVPVEILGLNDVPNAGEVLVATESDKEAKNFAATFISENKNKLLEETKSRMSLDDLFSQIQDGNLKELNLIVKADVQGSVEAVKQSLTKLSNEEVVVKVIHAGVGIINESDITLASASNAIIIGFNVKVDPTAKATAEHEKVDVRLYDIIYQAIEDIERAMKGMLDPIYEEKVIGHAEIRQIFKASGVGNIAGSYVMDGYFQRGCKVRITREGNQIFEGELSSLKRFKDDVKEVKAGFECGLTFDGFSDIQELDMVEAYIMVEVPR